MTKFKTEKRKAIRGERILVTKAKHFGDHSNYGNGEVLTVVRDYGDGVEVNRNRADGYFALRLFHNEYEVIIEEISSESARIDELERELRTLKVTQSAMKAELQSVRQVADKALREARKPVFGGIDFGRGYSGTATIESIDSSQLIPKQTPNERRAAVIERAKAFVANTKRKIGRREFRIADPSNGIAAYRTLRPEFIVNKEKRAVTVLLKGVGSSKLYAKGIAKCAPDDVFNADIGKAIALGRALGIKVPAEFIDAPKPTEPVVGMHVNRFNMFGANLGTISVDNVERKGPHLFVSVVEVTHIINDTHGYAEAFGDHIIDDTNAEYQQSQTKVSA